MPRFEVRTIMYECFNCQKEEVVYTTHGIGTIPEGWEEFFPFGDKRVEYLCTECKGFRTQIG